MYKLYHSAVQFSILIGWLILNCFFFFLNEPGTTLVKQTNNGIMILYVKWKKEKKILSSVKHTGLTGHDTALVNLIEKPEVAGLYKHQCVMTNECVSGFASKE